MKYKGKEYLRMNMTSIKDKIKAKSSWVVVLIWITIKSFIRRMSLLLRKKNYHIVTQTKKNRVNKHSNLYRR